MSEKHSDERSSFIKTPKQLVVVVVLAFLIPIGLIVMLTQLVTRSQGINPNNPAFSEEAIAHRLKPVGEVVFAEKGAPAAGEKTGKEIVATVCSACHGSGALGAPKIGDKAEWAPRIKLGFEKLVQAAIHGINKMPPRGGNASLTNAEVARAVAYMADQAGAKFKEPAAAPAAAAAAPAPATPAAAAAATAPAPAAARAAGGGDLAKGKTVFEGTCVACHGTGVLGAPKAGNKADWEPRIKIGMNALYNAALHGLKAMPPKGGNASLSDQEVKDAVDYMVSLVK